jgi:hypothetical protein
MPKLSPSLLTNSLICAVVLIVIAIAALRPNLTASTSFAPQNPTKLTWYKGNTHTHTLNSDGDSTPDEVVRWYREHGYQFLVLTDHNYLTSVDGLNALHGAEEKFLVIKGEEVTDDFQGKPIHINSLNPESLVKPQGGGSVLETMQRDVNAIRAARGVPHINHPNFHWAITAEDLKQLQNDKLFEIYNGHPQVNNLGGGGRPGLEEMWDIILKSGKMIYGIAVDDAHHFKRPWDATASTPGHGWVYVRAASLSAPAIIAALERGDFYASTGVELTDYEARNKQIKLTIKETKFSKYVVQFIGAGGKVLKEMATNPAVYDIQGNEQYVRVKVIESNGRFAWTQPVPVP